MGLRLSTLGHTELVSEGKLPPGLTTGRPLMLLVFLALEGRHAHSRQALSDLLWGDHDEATARRALRQALYIVRKALPAGCIEADAKQVRVNSEIPSDARDLEEALRAGDAARVASLYRGSFLGDLAAEWPAPFLEWAERQRARYDRLARQVLLDAAEAAAADGGIQATAGFLAAADVAEGFDLASEVRKVETWLAIGRANVAAEVAQRTLNRCVELEIELPREARARLESATLVRHSGRGVPESGSMPGTPQLAGRARERVGLLAAWRRAARGEGLTALVLGDPGIGKSRLIDEVASQARSEGATVLKGRGYALESGLLYGALIEVLRLALPAPGFAGVGDVWLSELSRLLPELMEKYPNLSPPGPEESGGRRRFYESVAQVLESLAFERPVFCVLDDLHWADEATLELLHYLGRRLCACSVLFVAGIRPGEATPALRRLQETLVREQGGVVIELGPLDKSDTRDLVSSMFGYRALPEGLDSLVWRSSEGNPLFAVSMVEVLAERRCVQVQDGWLAWDEAAAAGVPRVPERVRELIEARVRSLSLEETEVLRVGAVAGRAFTNRTVAAVLGWGMGEVDDLLLSLARRRLVQVRSGDEDSRWEFTHDRLREVVYERMTEELRTALHGAVARAAGNAGAESEPAAVAWHASLAGDREFAFRNALQAAVWARSVFAFDGARDMLRVAWANAPDGVARRKVEEELTRLPPHGRTPAPPGARWRMTRRAAMTAVLSVLIVAAGIAWGVASLRGRPGPPPLPDGLLVRVTENGSEYLGLVDPTRPGAPVQRLPAELLPLLPDDATFLSPDGAWVAMALSPSGQPPDVFAVRRDGADSVRLTDEKGDDIPLAWFPDGMSVLAMTGDAAAAGGYAYHLTRAYLDGTAEAVATAGQMRGGWKSVLGGAVSPDGTRIAAVIAGEPEELWLLDADGGNARRVPGHPALARIGFSPDGERIAFLEGDAGERLVVAALGADTTISLALPGPVGGAGPVWSADGRTVFLSVLVEGNQEVFGIATDGSGTHRMTFSAASEVLVTRLGQHPSYVDRVEILSLLPDGGALLAGDSVPVRAVARDNQGALVDAARVRVVCVAEQICTVAGGWLHGRAEGRTMLVANAGGWRADTLRVDVLPATPRLALAEDWEGGLTPAEWQAFGEPLPEIAERQGVSGSRGFLSNGNDNWESGVISVRSFPTRRGLSVDFWGRGTFGTRWPSWQYLMVGLTDAPLTSFVGDGPHPVPAPAVTVQNTGANLPVRLAALGHESDVTRIFDPSAWHRFTLQLYPSGRSELWIDGQFLWEGSQGSGVRAEARVVIGGRATHAPVIHDDVRVFDGILLRR